VTTHPTARRKPARRRPTRRPARRPARSTPLTAGTKLVILGIVLLVALAFFHDRPVPTTVVVVTGGLVYIAVTRRPHRHASPLDLYSLAAFQKLSPTQFEHAVADLARRSRGVRSADVQGGANDRGCDVLVTLHTNRRILIQCKRYTGSVGSEHVQIVNGTYRDIHHCDLALIVTTSGFTASAIETNARLRKPLRLVNGAALVAWANGGPSPLK
jgi:restriction system protein